MSISTILLEMRTERGLSQKDLAEAIGVSQSTIAKIEIGRNEATASTIRKLASYFGVTADQLLELEDEFGHRTSDDIIKRPKYEITDKQLQDVVKLFGVMTELQKAHILGYIIAYLEREGINVSKVLGY